jgi:hypothetical protein
MNSWEEKLDHVISVLQMQTGDTQHYEAHFISILARMKALLGYEWDATKTIRSHTTLLRSSATVVKTEEDCGLSKVSSLVLYYKQDLPHKLVILTLSGSRNII